MAAINKAWPTKRKTLKKKKINLRTVVADPEDNNGPWPEIV